MDKLKLKRADVLRLLFVAGYENDSATWTRIYLENRISMAVAKDRWNRGRACAARVAATGAMF